MNNFDKLNVVHDFYEFVCGTDYNLLDKRGCEIAIDDFTKDNFSAYIEEEKNALFEYQKDMDKILMAQRYLDELLGVIKYE